MGLFRKTAPKPQVVYDFEEFTYIDNVEAKKEWRKTTPWKSVMKLIKDYADIFIDLDGVDEDANDDVDEKGDTLSSQDVCSEPERASSLRSLQQSYQEALRDTAMDEFQGSQNVKYVILFDADGNADDDFVPVDLDEKYRKVDQPRSLELGEFDEGSDPTISSLKQIAGRLHKRVPSQVEQKGKECDKQAGNGRRKFKSDSFDLEIRMTAVDIEFPEQFITQRGSSDSQDGGREDEAGTSSPTVEFGITELMELCDRTGFDDGKRDSSFSTDVEIQKVANAAREIQVYIANAAERPPLGPRSSSDGDMICTAQIEQKFVRKRPKPAAKSGSSRFVEAFDAPAKDLTTVLRYKDTKQLLEAVKESKRRKSWDGASSKPDSIRRYVRSKGYDKLAPIEEEDVQSPPLSAPAAISTFSQASLASPASLDGSIDFEGCQWGNVIRLERRRSDFLDDEVDSVVELKTRRPDFLDSEDDYGDVVVPKRSVSAPGRLGKLRRVFSWGNLKRKLSK
ncbi:unnamed protein product [Periconia digitata]|uniref:Uncharacterized protein n=1 Tax=Periconia digitata TaxID=1303443 RepID=A0A9W4XYF0_9PLEO|nr:unnamed protein product [Periconia digitata]